MMNGNRYDEDARYKAANDIYSLYFIGWLIGFLTFVIGAVWASIQARRAGGFIKSHFQFQKSIAIQGILILLAAALINAGWSWWLDGDWSMPVMVVTIVVYIWWWLARCIAGYRILAQQQAIVEPKTWGKPRAAGANKQHSIEE